MEEALSLNPKGMKFGVDLWSLSSRPLNPACSNSVMHGNGSNLTDEMTSFPIFSWRTFISYSPGPISQYFPS